MDVEKIFYMKCIGFLRKIKKIIQIFTPMYNTNMKTWLNYELKKKNIRRKPKHWPHPGGVTTAGETTFSRVSSCSHCWCVLSDAGFGEVPLRGERDGHAAVHAVGHAGERSTSGVQPERRDPHQTGPVLCSGRRPQAAGDRSWSTSTFFPCQTYKHGDNTHTRTHIYGYICKCSRVHRKTTKEEEFVG